MNIEITMSLAEVIITTVAGPCIAASYYLLKLFLKKRSW